MATFCNEPWLVFLSRTGILPEDLWATETVCTRQSRRFLYPLYLFAQPRLPLIVEEPLPLAPYLCELKSEQCTLLIGILHS